VTRPRFIWPVYGFTDTRRRETVASFFECRDAEAMVRAPAEIGFEQRNLYCAEPRYDRRAKGYRYQAIEPARHVLTERARLGIAA
jgi:hypothetical protein